MMNKPNPLQPQGIQLDPNSHARSRVKLAVFFVIAIHVVGVMALLVQGCKREEPVTETQPLPPPQIPDFVAEPPPMVDTNADVLQPPIGDVMPPPANTNIYGYQPPVVPGTPPDNMMVEPPPTAGQEYKIERGDTFYSIGKKFGVSMQAIADANPTVNPNRLQIGQVIVIPPPKAATTPLAPSLGTPGQPTYTVKSGDTLSKIASDYNTTVKELRRINNLQTTVIRVGQVLKIPAPAGTATNGGM